SPTAALIAAPMPRAAQRTVWIVGSLFLVCALALGTIPVDRVIASRAKVISVTPTMIVQPLETSIVRSIEVREGQTVHAGDVLARLDRTFAAADADTVGGQVAALE